MTIIRWRLAINNDRESWMRQMRHINRVIHIFKITLTIQMLVEKVTLMFELRMIHHIFLECENFISTRS